MIGAWCMRPTKKQLDVAKKCGIGRLHLMVNDHSADRKPTAFRIDTKAREYARMITDAGIELHITSWIMPHVEFLTRACAELVQLSLDTGAHSIEWDAEAPWTHASGGMPWDQAAAMMQLYGSREGVSGIGYTKRAALAPLVARADYVTPQAYVTRTSGMQLAGIPSVLERWKGMVTKATIIPALAAYSQPPDGIVNSWKHAGKPDTVMLWALRHLNSSYDYSAIADLRNAMEATR